VNLEAVNTTEHEGQPFISSDGNELWFTRRHRGTPGIFRSMKVDGNWQKPELIVSQFAGEPTLDDAGNLYFVHHFFEDNQMIEADIYLATMTRKVQAARATQESSNRFAFIEGAPLLYGPAAAPCRSTR